MGHDVQFHIRACAEAILARNMQLAGLAIAIICLALVDDPTLALMVGGGLNLAGCLVLIALALDAERKDFRRTEVWALLRDHVDMPLRTAQIVFGGILRACYLRAARLAGLAGALFLAMSALWYAAHHFGYGAAEAGHPPALFLTVPGRGSH
jgi:hypothetical protein